MRFPANSAGARSKGVVAFALVSALAFGACGSGDDAPKSQGAATETQKIEIDTFVFKPESQVVAPGTTVEWNNGDAILHTVTSGAQRRQGIPGVGKGKPARADGTFDLELDGKGSSASFTFDEPGTYNYFCRVHAAMTGRIVVE